METLQRDQIAEALTQLNERLAAVGAGDIRFLASRLALRSAEEVLEVVLSYYPAERLPVRTRLLLEEMFDDGG